MTVDRTRLTTLAGVGIGLRARHVDDVMASHPAVAWLEIHAENYMGGGGARRALQEIRHWYPISVHGVGLSLGSAGRLSQRHLRRLKSLVEWLEPALVSEHLSWSVDGVYLNHLLPLPYTEESLLVMCRHVDQAQRALGRRILIENPSSYLRFRYSPIPEPEFLVELTRRTGCGLLCDVNNIYVTAYNLGLDPVAYLDALPTDRIVEIHLAGHCRNDADGVRVLIDDHGSRVAPEVWELYAGALTRWGPRPTLIEWDTAIPALHVLMDEAQHATSLVNTLSARAHALAG